jgi:acetyl-CoA carboxylase biotin carboxyl carrier protein
MEEKDLNELRELVEFLKASGIAEFEMERPDLKVGLKFVGAGAPAAAGIDAAVLAGLLAGAKAPVQHVEDKTSGPVNSAGGSGTSTTPPAGTHAVEPEPHAEAHVVKSPIVGTFYDASSPDAEPFVQVGDTVAVGTVLCIIEAMKLMNEIESDAAGEIVKVFVKPGQPVEYGQALFAVK